MVALPMPRRLRVLEGFKEGIKYVGKGLKNYFFWPGAAHDYLEQDRGWRCGYANQAAFWGGALHTVGEGLGYYYLLDRFMPEGAGEVADNVIVGFGLLRVTPTMIRWGTHRLEQRDMARTLKRAGVELR